MEVPPTGWLQGGWRTQHLDCCRLARPAGADLALLGDSLLQAWGGEGRRVAAPGAPHRETAFGRARVANLAVAGDRVRHVVWRVAHGALEGLAPARLLLVVGTNDLADGASPGTVAPAVAALAGELLDLLPATRLLLHGLLPRGASAADPLRHACAETNRLLQECCEGLGDRVEWMDPSAAFLGDDGSLRAGLYTEDALHLTADGYAAWADLLAATCAVPSAAAAAAPAFADGAPRALERGWIRAEAEAGLIVGGTVSAGAALALVACVASGIVEGTLAWILAGAWLAGSPLLLWIVARWPHWEYPRAGYRLRPDRVEAWRGLFWRRSWSVPCARVQFTDVSQGPLQRRHRIATLQVHTAGTASSQVSVPGLPLALAVEIRDWLVDRTSDDAV